MPVTFIRYTHHLKIEKPNNLVLTTCLWNNLHQVHVSSKDWKVFQSLDNECTWWRLFHKHVVPTKLFGFSIFRWYVYLMSVCGITFIRYTHHLKIEKTHNLVGTTCLWNNLHQVHVSSKDWKNYVVFQSLDDTCTWWRLFHKHVVPTKLFGFSIFRWCVYLMNVIPQTRRAHI
jgi:hypothetical protein